MDQDFVPTGDWWGQPLWRKALLMVTLRPWCLVKGYVAVARQWVALRSPNRPLHPMSWVHPEPCDVFADYGGCHHDEFHPSRDKCLDGHEIVMDAHYLQYERALDVPYSCADDFDSRVGRMYAFTDLDETIRHLDAEAAL